MTAVAEHAREAEPKARTFISYSRKDMAFADRLEAALKARGLKPLIDRSGISDLEDWRKRIGDLIAQADTVVFVLSPDAVMSRECKKEVEYAASLNSGSRQSSVAALTMRRCQRRWRASTESISLERRSRSVRIDSPTRSTATLVG
jgi:hypothetical protein